MEYAVLYAGVGAHCTPYRTSTENNAYNKTEDTTFIIAIIARVYDYYGDPGTTSQR